jgi:hypothetical protein
VCSSDLTDGVVTGLALKDTDFRPQTGVAGWIDVRRIGDDLQFRLRALQAVKGGPNNVFASQVALPTGFRCTRAVNSLVPTASAVSFSGAHWAWSMPGAGWGTPARAGNSDIKADSFCTTDAVVSFPTSGEPWPTTLPGTTA